MDFPPIGGQHRRLFKCRDRPLPTQRRECRNRTADGAAQITTDVFGPNRLVIDWTFSKSLKKLPLDIQREVEKVTLGETTDRALAKFWIDREPRRQWGSTNGAAQRKDVHLQRS
jgi:hypothetical protein